jgi:nucleoside-diphosphate kinase
LVKEKTLIVVKPDGVERGLVGEILSRFEARGLKILELKMQRMKKERAETFYSVHRDKPFYRELVSFISSGSTVGAVIEGEDAIATVRRMVGATKSWDSAPGTIRGDLGMGLLDNVIHASDSSVSFRRENKAYFS